MSSCDLPVFSVAIRFFRKAFHKFVAGNSLPRKCHTMSMSVQTPIGAWATKSLVINMQPQNANVVLFNLSCKVSSPMASVNRFQEVIGIQ